ncbi:hypothetical protein [Blastococcus sp. SYSU DS0539]
MKRSPVPIASAAELGIWWAEVLSEPNSPEQALSLLWFDSAGHRLGRVLSISGVAPRPDRKVTGFVRQLHDTLVGDSGDPAHLALALSRRGRPSVTTADREWVSTLQASLDSDDGST